MGRRKSTSDEVLALRGNAHAAARVRKQRALLKQIEQQPGHAVEAPDFLTSERERALFRRARTSPLLRRAITNTDVSVLARWASYLAQWIEAKAALDAGEPPYKLVKSKHVERHLRGPALSVMLDLERMLTTLEDRLGLSPASRQDLLRALALPGPLLPAPAIEAEPDQPSPPSPIGWGKIN